MSADPTVRAAVGRPVATTHAAIEQAAFRLFAEHGFEGTTLDMIAARVGVGRRTLFRYFESKNDIPWGQFADTLQGLAVLLRAMPEDLPLSEAVLRGVLAFNDFPEHARPSHRERMRLILGTPALQAHAALRYAEWRAVIAEYVAERTGGDADDLLPRTVGHVSLALALAAYDAWLADPESALLSLLAESMEELRCFLA
jgi:mycofactocin system transcriptional regulator